MDTVGSTQPPKLSSQTVIKLQNIPKPFEENKECGHFRFFSVNGVAPHSPVPPTWRCHWSRTEWGCWHFPLGQRIGLNWVRSKFHPFNKHVLSSFSGEVTFLMLGHKAWLLLGPSLCLSGRDRHRKKPCWYHRVTAEMEEGQVLFRKTRKRSRICT